MKRTPVQAFAALATILLLAMPAGAKSYEVGTEDSSEYVPPQAVEAPKPQLPEHQREECFKSCCIARFMIGADGSAKVRLLSSTGSEEVDDITLQTLKRWKFKPAMLDGKPVPSTRRVTVEYQVD